MSLSKPLRSVENVKDNQKEYVEYIESNGWLKEICEICDKVPVIDMDNVKKLIDKDRKSCDALWYSYNGERKSILAELKNSSKSKVMDWIRKDGKEKRIRAARNVVGSRKETKDIFDGFADYVEKSGLCGCTKEEFPGNALPRLSKSKEGKKVRKFSLFSASDFAEIVTEGFFEGWDWGEYLV